MLGDRFELLVQVGQGGMGWIFRAHDRLLDEEVGIKVLRSDVHEAEGMAARFRREIRLARRVLHPNVCPIFDYNEERGLSCITMEFIDGVDLSRATDAGGLWRGPGARLGRRRRFPLAAWE